MLKPKTGTELQAARAAMRAKCIAAALTFTPPTVRCVYTRTSLTGHAYSDPHSKLFGEIHAPRPFTRNALYIYLHECAHVALQHNSSRPRHVEEYEAEELAHEWMGQAGIPVPRRQTLEARAYVARKISQAVRRGAKGIDPKAAKFAGVKRKP